jgi:hypothetical protein
MKNVDEIDTWYAHIGFCFCFTPCFLQLYRRGEEEAKSEVFSFRQAPKRCFEMIHCYFKT